MSLALTVNQSAATSSTRDFFFLASYISSRIWRHGGGVFFQYCQHVSSIHKFLFTRSYRGHWSRLSIRWWHACCGSVSETLWCTPRTVIRIPYDV